MALGTTQRPCCPALCPAGEAPENSKDDDDLRNLRCLKASFQRDIFHKVETGQISALYEDSLSGLGTRCLEQRGKGLWEREGYILHITPTGAQHCGHQYLSGWRRKGRDGSGKHH